MDIVNKKARQNYQILETLEAGIELVGPEVKSVRSGRVSLEGAHIHIGIGPSRTLEAHVIGMHAARYLPSGTQVIDATRFRRLLLHKNEILALYEKTKAKRLTVVPLRLYLKRNLVKVEVGLVRGKRKWEKREDIKQRDVAREIERALKR